LSSLTALVAIVFLGVAIRRALARLAVMDQQRNHALERAEVLLVGLAPLMAAARACLWPCPSCDIGSGEPCLCEARRHALAGSLRGAESAIELALERPCD
jgi:hypothetical protein